MKNRIDFEKETVEKMIRLFYHCRRRRPLPPEARQLLDYCLQRLDHCPAGQDKLSCKRCPRHCYQPERREQIRQVMRWAGPRMIFYHPICSIRHLFSK